MTRYLTLAAALAVLSAIPALALAQEATGQDAADEGPTEPDASDDVAVEPDATEEARLHFMAARSHYDAGRLDDAIREYQLSYDLSGRPEMLYNIHLAHRDAGRPADAARFLRRFLEAATDLEPEQRRVYERSLGRFERAGRGEPDEPDEPAPRDPDAPSGGDGLATAGWILLGVGGATLAAALVTGLLTLDAFNALSDDCGPTRLMCPPGFQDRVEEGQRLQLATDVLWPTGAGFAIVGLVLVIIGATEGSAADVEAACGSTGCAAAVRF